MKKNLIKMISETNYKVIRVTKTEFELEEDISVEEFQKLMDSSKELIVDLLKKIDEQ